jgi:dihydropteroate synthase type 2
LLARLPASAARHRGLPRRELAALRYGGLMAAAVVGILNLTEDSFSDGGRFLDPETAIAQGERLLDDGADWLDLGAESSNPQGREVPAELELARLRPVLQHFAGRGARLSVDTHKPEVMRAVLDLGAGMINDITGLADPASVAVLARSSVPVVVMHSRNRGPRADTAARPDEGLVDEIGAFFQERLATLAAAGIARERIVIDPGMGFFLGPTPEPSLTVLRHLPALAALGPVYLSTSRKSFIGALTGRPAAERAAGTLASELWALAHGVSYVRTHDVRGLVDGWRVWRAIEGTPVPGALEGRRGMR